MRKTVILAISTLAMLLTGCACDYWCHVATVSTEAAINGIGSVTDKPTSAPAPTYMHPNTPNESLTNPQRWAYTPSSDLRGELGRLGRMFDSATDDIYLREDDCAHPVQYGAGYDSSGGFVCGPNPKWNPQRGLRELRVLSARAQFDALFGIVSWSDVHGDAGILNDVSCAFARWNERVARCKRGEDRNCDVVLGR
jgi:hypothetical protein